MNIVKAHISDRRFVKKRPVLVVTVDEMPVPTNDVIKRTVDGKQWTSAKYGPLIEFSAGSIAKWDILDDSLSPAGWYNQAFSDGLAPVVDVKVILGPEYKPLDGHWAVQLRRGRSLMRKYELPWRLLMSDYEGQNGRVSWVPVENYNTCAHNFFVDPYKEADCKNIGTNHVAMAGIDYWFCPVHFKDHNAKLYAARTGR